jgi:hypothetical protein
MEKERKENKREILKTNSFHNISVCIMPSLDYPSKNEFKR